MVMCGRFKLEDSSQELTIRYKAPLHTLVDWEKEPRLNDVTPGRRIPVVANFGGSSGRKIDFLNWGSWFYKKKEPNGPEQMDLFGKKSAESFEKISFINSKTETILNSYGRSSSVYTDLLDNRRVIIPVNSFYEWHQTTKQKHEFALDEHITSLAGYSIYTRLRPEEAVGIVCVVLITTAANKIMSPYHHRQPVPLSKDDEMDWVAGVETGKTYLEHIFNNAQQANFRVIE